MESSCGKLPGVEQLVVVDAGSGMVAALVASHFQQLGASTFRVEPPAPDPFDDVYPAHALWRSGCRTLNRAQAEEQLREADICIVGGEDYPGYERSFAAATVAALNPRLVVLDLTGYLPGGPRGPAVDLLVQARSGLSYTELNDRPRCLAFRAPSYGAALLGMIVTWSALLERERSGRGKIVRASMQQGAALWCAGDWFTVERPDVTARTRIPLGVRQLAFRCGDGEYLQFVLSSPGALSKAHTALGIEQNVDPNDRGLPKDSTDAKNFYGDIALFEQYVAKFRRDELLRRLWDQGLAAEPTLPPGAAWSEEQVARNEILETRANGQTVVGCPLRFQAARAVAAKRVAAPQTASRAPLAGLRVLDFGAFVAGPFASRLLADLGADVIKIEPLSADPTRYNFGVWSASNQGKRALCVNLKTEEGGEILRRLCAAADIVQHNFRPGVAERVGIDPANLRRMNPHILTLSTSAYGESGPKALNSGFDMVVQALCGHAVAGSGAGNLPQSYRAFFVDTASGALGACAMLAAAFARSRSGQVVDAQTNLLNVALYLMSELVRSKEGAFSGVEPVNSDLTGRHPAEQFYQLSDGWIAIAARSSAMAASLAHALDLELPPREQWGEGEARAIAARLSSRRRDDVLRQLAQAGVWAESCVEDGWAELRGDNVARTARFVVEMNDAVRGRVLAVAPALQSERTCGAAAAPALGEHTREILRELEFSAEEIDELYRKDIVR